jgi:hypothetical protein
MTTHHYDVDTEQANALAANATVLRVPVEPQPKRYGHSWAWDSPRGLLLCSDAKILGSRLAHYSPYQPGDTLLVREPWMVDAVKANGRFVTHWGVRYKAGDSFARFDRANSNEFGVEQMEEWQPASTMPDWAIRLRYTIKAVVLEQIAEYLTNRRVGDEIGSKLALQGHAFERYRDWWNTIHPDHPFDSNPWTYAIELERLEAGDE